MTRLGPYPTRPPKITKKLPSGLPLIAPHSSLPAPFGETWHAGTRPTRAAWGIRSGGGRDVELDRERIGRNSCSVEPGRSTIEQAICAPGASGTMRSVRPAAPAIESRAHARDQTGLNDLRGQRLDPQMQQILVIDDEPSILRAIQRCLSQYKVTIAGSGKAGLAHARANTFDLIISDLHLPDLTGVQIVSTLRKEHPGLATQFLIMTGGTHDEDLRRTLARSRLPVLYKPFRPAELRESVEGSLQVLQRAAD